jgi:hypothetical protein
MGRLCVLEQGDSVPSIGDGCAQRLDAWIPGVHQHQSPGQVDPDLGVFVNGGKGSGDGANAVCARHASHAEANHGSSPAVEWGNSV